MRLKLLGTGNAAGMPLYGCDCINCLLARQNRDLQRTACSAQLDTGGVTFLLDAGQLNLAETYPHGTLNGILLTHFHPDHVQGLLHLRWGIGNKIPVYCPPDDQGCADLFKHPGILDFLPQQAFSSFSLGDMEVTPLPLNHSKNTHGYFIQRNSISLAYLTDTKGLPERTEKFLISRNINLMVIDCSYVPGSNKGGHNNLNEVIEIAERTQPHQVVLTHIGHDLDIWLKQNPAELPENIIAGYDGMELLPGQIDG
ncbi:MAG: phosphonate metabolism protein PhnP [Neptuniibacter sp.]